MENSHLQLTMREITHDARSPRFWAGLLGVVCILTVSAPFATAEQFNDIQRFFYWLGIAVSTYFPVAFILLLVCLHLEQAGISQLKARMIASLLAGVAVACLVFFINAVILGIDELRWKTFLFLGTNCLLVTLAVAAIYFIVFDSLARKKAAEPEPEKPVSAFCQRLSKSLGSDLISLQAQDHYVEAKTTQGSELILLRLSDAIKELGDDNGLQVHRSWWVSYQHIVELKRVQNKPHLMLSDGTAVPVSRTYHAAVKAFLHGNGG